MEERCAHTACILEAASSVTCPLVLSPRLFGRAMFKKCVSCKEAEFESRSVSLEVQGSCFPSWEWPHWRFFSLKPHWLSSEMCEGTNSSVCTRHALLQSPSRPHLTCRSREMLPVNTPAHGDGTTACAGQIAGPLRAPAATTLEEEERRKVQADSGLQS